MPDDESTADPTADPAAGARPRRHWWLLVVPFVWCIGAVPLVGQRAYVWGSVPFLLVWMVAGVLVGSATIAVVYVVDRRHGDLERT